MHNNTWVTLLLISIPAALVLLIGLFQSIRKKKPARMVFIFGGVLLLIPIIFIIGNIISKRKEMEKTRTIYFNQN